MSQQMEKNYGINITGGNVSAGAMAAGRDARATNISSTSADSLPDIRAGMSELLELLRGEADKLDRPEETIAVAELAERELGEDEPDKLSVLRWLKIVATGAGSVTSVAGAVTAIQQAVAAIL
jgi:hypothetical protein